MWRHYQIQTTFTPVHAQGPERAEKQRELSVKDQVADSIDTSLMIFRDPDTLLGYLDAVILHEPYSDICDTLVAMNAITAYMEEANLLKKRQLVRHHGISNVSTMDLRHYWKGNKASSTIPPPIVQNRMTCTNNCDWNVRRLCDIFHLEYQAFGVLSKPNKAMLEDKETVVLLAEEAGVSREAALYALLLGLCLPDLEDKGLVSVLKEENNDCGPELIKHPDKIKILNGTSNVAHMTEDLAGVDKAVGLLKDAVAWELIRLHRVHHGYMPPPEEIGVPPEQMPYSKIRKALVSFKKGLTMEEELSIESLLGELTAASDLDMCG